MKKQVVILAGGLGTRLRPLTEKIPKPLVEVANRPFLDWQLQDLKQQGYRDVLLLVSYLGEQIENVYGDGSHLGLSIRYSFETEPLGTGGALRLALPLLKETFVLLNGDSFLRAYLDAMVEYFEASDFLAMVSSYDLKEAVPVPANLKIADRGRVVDYQKGAGQAAGFTCVDSGIYILRKALLESPDAQRYAHKRFQLEELWPELIQRRALGAFAVNERFYDIGTPERLKEFEEKVHDYFPYAF